MDSYPLDSEKLYYSSDLLTLDCEDGPVTLKLAEWLQRDPVRIHKMVVKRGSQRLAEMNPGLLLKQLCDILSEKSL